LHLLVFAPALLGAALRIRAGFCLGPCALAAGQLLSRVATRWALNGGRGMEINGIAHIQLSVSDFAASRAFYGRLLPALGLTVQYDEPGVYYCIGGRTGVLITPCADDLKAQRFNQLRAGLHHLCFRARTRADVDGVYALLQQMGATVVHPPEDGPWAPGYYSLLFEDPDGIRLEINHVPGKGNLDPAVSMPHARPE
jgi:catechol 2,3-dioxygenase-like lactoylglutathione lyase family enzyme